MGKLSYILGTAMRMDYKELFRTAGLVHAITGRGSPAVGGDVLGWRSRVGRGV